MNLEKHKNAYKEGTVLNCSICGSYAVTMNLNTCISKRSGKICGGKIGRIKKQKTKR